MKVAIASQDPDIAAALRNIIASAPQHDLVWTATSGGDAARRCAVQCPDVLLMALATSGTEAVDATRKIMATTPCGIILVTTSVQRDSAPVFAAMGVGALDVVALPSTAERKGTAKAIATQVLQKIRMAGMLSPAASAPAASASRAGGSDIQLVAIGASAGGPPAIAAVLHALPADLRAAIVVVQHIDTQFSESMAEWFGTQTPLIVRIARDNEPLEPGVVFLAAGDQHLVVSPQQTLMYTMEPRRSPYRPSADVLFDSIARHWSGTAIGIILSGMGRDGAAGLRRLRDRGDRTIAQDKSTSAVYGMPRAAVEIDAATDVLPLPAIGPMLRELLCPRDGHRGLKVPARP